VREAEGEVERDFERGGEKGALILLYLYATILL
jgi:hypothetical protein